MLFDEMYLFYLLARTFLNAAEIMVSHFTAFPMMDFLDTDKIFQCVLHICKPQPYSNSTLPQNLLHMMSA